jgi:hypothetical protein
MRIDFWTPISLVLVAGLLATACANSEETTAAIAAGGLATQVIGIANGDAIAASTGQAVAQGALANLETETNQDGATAPSSGADDVTTVLAAGGLVTQAVGMANNDAVTTAVGGAVAAGAMGQPIPQYGTGGIGRGSTGGGGQSLAGGQCSAAICNQILSQMRQMQKQARINSPSRQGQFFDAQYSMLEDHYKACIIEARRNNAC